MFLATFVPLAIAVFFLILILQLGIGHRHVRFLKNIPPTDTFPAVSIIVPARNEERNIETALNSLLAQDYPDLEIMVINDRSTDGTDFILRRMALKHPTLSVITIEELPPGWLGKNHALYVGAGKARGDYLLFTDADVVMAPSTVSRAVAQMLRTGIDHLAGGPEVTMRGTVLNIFAAGFMIFFTLYARPWSVQNPGSASHIGIGAFNMVRSSAYRAAGGHRAIAMRPDDDMKLGKLLKKRGFSQQLVLGRGMLSVEWYSSLRELVRGLEKNAFAGLEYSWGALIAGSAALFLAFVWPVPGLVTTTGLPRMLYAATVLSWAGISWYCSRLYGIRLRYFLGLPAATLLFLFILWRSALLAWRNRGIDWRGTHYPLDQLKSNRV